MYIAGTAIEALILRCRECSSAINDYFEERLYLLEVDDIESVTPIFLRNKAVSLVLTELQSIGLVFNTPADVLEDVFTLNLMFALRARFDRNYLTELLRKLDEDIYTSFCTQVEQVELAEDLLLEVAYYLHDLFPLDEKWSIIAQGSDVVMSDGQLTSHLNAIISNIDTNYDRNHAVVTESNLDEVAAFLKNMEQRQAIARSLAEDCLKHFPEINKIELMGEVDRYDYNKLSPDKLQLFASYHEVEGKPEPSFVKEHHRTTNHHLEYYQGRNGHPFPSKAVCVMIVISLWLDKLSREQMHQRIAVLGTFAECQAEFKWINQLIDHPLWDVKYNEGV